MLFLAVFVLKTNTGYAALSQNSVAPPPAQISVFNQNTELVAFADDVTNADDADSALFDEKYNNLVSRNVNLKFGILHLLEQQLHVQSLFNVYLDNWKSFLVQYAQVQALLDKKRNQAKLAQITSSLPISNSDLANAQPPFWLSIDTRLLWLVLFLAALSLLLMALNKRTKLSSTQIKADYQAFPLSPFNTSPSSPIIIPPALTPTSTPAIPHKAKLDNRMELVLADAGKLMRKRNGESAVALLENYLQRQPKQSVYPWLFLLQIHDILKQKSAFAETVERLHQTFGVNFITTEENRSSNPLPEISSAYPHILAELEKVWTSDEAQDYLHFLPLNNPATQPGFSIEVLKEISVLQQLLEIGQNQLPNLSALIQKQPQQFIQKSLSQ
jgi:hypothetical protein